MPLTNPLIIQGETLDFGSEIGGPASLIRTQDENQEQPGVDSDGVTDNGVSGTNPGLPDFDIYGLDLSRNCSAPLTWYFATKEKHHGTETNPSVPRRGSAGSVDERLAA